MEIKQLITVQAIELHLWSETKIEPGRQLRLGKSVNLSSVSSFVCKSLRYASCSMSGLRSELWHRALALKNDMDFVEFVKLLE